MQENLKLRNLKMEFYCKMEQQKYPHSISTKTPIKAKTPHNSEDLIHHVTASDHSQDGTH
jgi:hypothetical protein